MRNFRVKSHHSAITKIIFNFFKCITLFLITFFMAVITGCGQPKEQPKSTSAFFSRTDVRRYAYLGLQQLKADHYQKARIYFAKGLRENPNNCELNFFNGLSYQLEGQDGSIKMLELASIGYRNAIRVCPNDPWPYYYSGVVAVQKNNLPLAEKMFSTASAVSGDSTTLFLKGYLYAAYNDGDIKGVKDVITQLKKADPNSKLVEEISSAFQYIRTPKPVSKKTIVAKKKKCKRVTPVPALTTRSLPKPITTQPHPVVAKNSAPLPPAGLPAPAVKPAVGAANINPPLAQPAMQNKNLSLAMNQNNQMQQPQAMPPSNPQPPTPPGPAPMQGPAQQNLTSNYGQPPGSPMLAQASRPAFPPQAGGFPQRPGMPGGFGPPVQEPDHRQVIVDGVIILSREKISSQQGVNLLQGLQLQYGNGTTPGLSYTNSSIGVQGWKGATTAIPAGATSAGAFTLPTLPFSAATVSTISIPAVTYDLNIFNDADEKSEVLARPSVLVESGHSATYFSGRDLILGIQGSQTGTITQFPLGVTMKLTPLFQKNGSIDLTVQIGREFLIPADNTTSFTQVAQALKESTATSVNLHYGQTIILSTLYDSKLDTTRNETPILSKIPIIGLFFGKKTRSNTLTNLIMLLTPRKYVHFHSEEYNQLTLQQLINLYTSRLKNKTHLGDVVKKLRNIEIYDLHSPVKAALNRKEISYATSEEVQLMSEDDVI